MPQGKCNNHGIVETKWVEGDKDGRHYAFWSCTKREKDQFGNWVKCRIEPANTPNGNFNQDLDRSAAQKDNQTKDETITRLAIAKSLIENRPSWTMDTVAEAEKVLSWVTGKNKALVDALLKGQSVGVADAIKQSERLPEEDTIPLDQIPF